MLATVALQLPLMFILHDTFIYMQGADMQTMAVFPVILINKAVFVNHVSFSSDLF